MKAVCVFCGSSPGRDPAFAEHATVVAERLVARNLDVVYGGGKAGLMGVMANRAMELGGRVIGVIPRSLVEREVAHDGLSDLKVTETMHERKKAMADHADAFLTLPGGYGTLEEVSEVLSWNQIGLYRKPIGLLNVAGYFDGLLQFFDTMVGRGFLRPEGRSLAIADTDVDRLLDRLAAVGRQS